MNKQQLWLTYLNFIETWRLIVAGTDQGEIYEFDGLLVTDSGLSFANFNVAFVQRPLREAEDTIERLRAHFASRELPALVCFPPGVDERTESLLSRRGYQPAKPLSGMALAPIAPPAQGASGLEVRLVQDDGELARFHETAEAGFGIPLKLLQQLLSARLRDQPNVSLFLGYAGGQPVCTACLVASVPVAGVYWVATRPDFRRRGFGTAISWHAIQTGQALGCEIATLQASAMGRPVYERMGFRKTADFHRYRINPGP